MDKRGNKMKILIFGGAGFVASHLVDYCLSKNDEVIVTVRWNEDLSRMEHFKDKVKIEYVELTDLSSIIRCINKHRPDVISHLAAQSWVTSSMDNPIYTMKNNVESTLNILEAVRLINDIQNADWPCYENPDSNPHVEHYCCGKVKYNPLIHICSSSEFYGKVERDDLTITENHKANPGNIYGASKVTGDFLAQIYEKYYDLRILITRMFTHFGVGRTMMSAENYYTKEISRLENETCYPDSLPIDKYVIKIGDELAMNSLRTWADVRDAVKNYYTLFKNQKTGIYNVSGETIKTIQEVLDYLISISNLDKTKLKFIASPEFIRKINVDKQIVDIT